MFDDPKKSLRQMEEALWAAEEENEEDWLQAAKDLLGEEPEEEETFPIRNQANGYGRSRQNRAVDFERTVFDDEVTEESSAVFVPEPEKKGIGGLVVLAALEVAAIAAVALWWVQWLR